MSVLKIKDSRGNWVGVPQIKGDNGDTGPQGPKGDSGTDGISPTVTITPITGGHRITITDKDGTKTADVMDGTTPDLGWSVENTQLFSETVTTVAQEWGNDATFSYNQFINSDVITVTFDGTDYECNRLDFGDFFGYGGMTETDPDFSQYPFAIGSYSDGYNFIYTQSVGTYSVAVSAMSAVVSSDFEKAVAVAEPSHDFEIIPGTTTWAEAETAFTSKKNVYYFLMASQKAYVLYVGMTQNNTYKVWGVTVTENGVLSYVGLSASSKDGVLS